MNATLPQVIVFLLYITAALCIAAKPQSRA